MQPQSVESEMQRPVSIPAIFSGVASKVDRSYKLTFNTRELNGADAAVLLGLHQTEGHLLFAPTEISESDIPEEPAKSGIAEKTPHQRLRSTLFVYWKQRGEQGDFDAFYRERMERIIEQYKEKLDD